MPTRTGPEPRVSPTVGPGAPCGGWALGAAAPIPGISIPVELQPASVNASPAPTNPRRVTARRRSDDSDTNLISISPSETRRSRQTCRLSPVPHRSLGPARSRRRLSAEIVAFSPALGYVVDVAPGFG